MPLVANASPTKRFFIENLTRDLSLEDAILDLIDNSVDGYIRTRGIEVAASLLRVVDSPPSQQENTAVIEIEFTEDEFVIKDRCGGIGLDRAKDYAFRFGNAEATATGSLGVYGIGMKRALFKLGRNITVVSKTEQDGFKVCSVPHFVRQFGLACGLRTEHRAPVLLG